MKEAIFPVIALSPDGKFILFDSARPAESENSGIYVRFRKDGGKYIFFSRDNDIWWVSARVVGELRDRPRTS